MYHLIHGWLPLPIWEDDVRSDSKIKKKALLNFNWRAKFKNTQQRNNRDNKPASDDDVGRQSPGEEGRNENQNDTSINNITSNKNTHLYTIPTVEPIIPSLSPRPFNVLLIGLSYNRLLVHQ